MIIPYYGIKKLHEKYIFGKEKSNQFRIELKDLLSDYYGFNSFSNQLIQEHEKIR